MVSGPVTAAGRVEAAPLADAAGTCTTCILLVDPNSAAGLDTGLRSDRWPNGTCAGDKTSLETFWSSPLSACPTVCPRAQQLSAPGPSPMPYSFAHELRTGARRGRRPCSCSEVPGSQTQSNPSKPYTLNRTHVTRVGAARRLSGLLECCGGGRQTFGNTGRRVHRLV